jgi:sugar transferase (PEP-CTERM/EpsH1 system associated)
MHVVRKGFAGGGMEGGIINVTNGLTAGRFQVSICALDSRETFSERVRRPDFACYLLPKKDGVEWWHIWRLARLFRRTRVDVVHSHNWGTFLYSVLAAKFAGVPIIHGEHGKNLNELNEINLPKSCAKRLLGRRVNRLVTVSQTIASEWADYGVPPDKIEWIPNGVDVERFQPRPEKQALRHAFGLPEHGLLIGSVGRFDPIKNYEVLVEAFARLAPRFPEIGLAFLGEGPCEANLRSLADTLAVKDRIFWLGRRPDPEDFLPALDIFVLPSVSEGMSNVVLETMASGLPVVCADLPGHREVFTPGSEGVVVFPCDAQTLGDALAGLLENAERRLELGMAARRRVLARFNLRHMISDYERLYARFAQPEQTEAVAVGVERG